LVNSVTKFDMNPQIIADGILKVIQMEPGQRPLRYPIDPIADGTDQEFIDTRAAVKKKWMSRYGFDY
jgi:hypothetical protein